MKVLFNTYPFAFQNPGGGEIIILRLKENLEKLGVKVDCFNQWQSKFSEYDIIHEFSTLQWNAWAGYKLYGPKLVVTPTHWPKNIFPHSYIDRCKNFLKVNLLNQKNTFHQAWELPDLIFPTSSIELNRIKNFYNIKHNRFKVIPNGTELKNLNSVSKNAFAERHQINNYLLFVGRITPIKNLLSLIEAVNQTQEKLVIIGDPNSDDTNYYEQCQRIANSNIKFIPSIPHESDLLWSAYMGAKAVIVPSYFETCSLVGLEAASVGTNVIMTELGATKEVYKDKVQFINPHSIDSIKTEILNLKKNDNLKDFITQNYSWDKISRDVLAGYESVL